MSDSRKLRTGPTDGGRCEANTARSRVTPPSTGSTYTTSASATPVHGPPSGELSTLTGVGVGGAAGRAAVPPRVLQITTPMTTATTTAITSASALVASDPFGS